MSSVDENDVGIPLIEDIESSENDVPNSNKKRKRSATEQKAVKKRQTKKPKDIDDETLDDNLHVNHAIAHMDPALLADHIAERTKRFKPDLSLVEADDLHVSSQAILDTTGFTSDRVAANLPQFLEQFVVTKAKDKVQKLSTSPKEPGAPHTLVVTAAGIRAADLTRPLRKYQSKTSIIAKLFAKHIKLKEASETTKKTRMGIGVGTPQRLIDLLDNDSLNIKHLERIVIDASYIDQKKRGILDISEVQGPLVSLLTRSEIKARYDDERKRIMLLFY